MVVAALGTCPALPSQRQAGTLRNWLWWWTWVPALLTVNLNQGLIYIPNHDGIRQDDAERVQVDDSVETLLITMMETPRCAAQVALFRALRPAMEKALLHSIVDTCCSYLPAIISLLLLVHHPYFPLRNYPSSILVMWSTGKTIQFTSGQSAHPMILAVLIISEIVKVHRFVDSKFGLGVLMMGIKRFLMILFEHLGQTMPELFNYMTQWMSLFI